MKTDHIIEAMKSQITYSNKITKAICDFYELHPILADGERIAGCCEGYSTMFVRAYPELKGQVVTLMGYRTPKPNRAKYYKAYQDPDAYFCHSVVVIDRLVIDFTYRQLDTQYAPAGYRVSSWADLMNEWMIICFGDRDLGDELPFYLSLKEQTELEWWEKHLKNKTIILTGTANTNKYIARLEMSRALHRRSKFKRLLDKLCFWKKR